MPGEDAADVPEMTVGQLKTHVDKRFEAVDMRFEAVDQRFEAFRQEIASDRARLDGRLENHEARIVVLERRKRRSRA